jgi:ATP-dependent Clp protease ATP-binding subunit ClpC
MEATLPTNLTPRVQRILEQAAEEAQAHGHSYVGTEHLILALIEVGDGVASEALDELGVTEAVRNRVKEIMASDSYKG